MTGDTLLLRVIEIPRGFNSRPSCDGRRPLRRLRRRCRRVSIHARRVTGDRGPATDRRTNGKVSIHARRVTGDLASIDRIQSHVVSIHARRVTGDASDVLYIDEGEFQFTPVV